MIINDDNIEELHNFASMLRDKAVTWCEHGVHERASDLIEMAECAEHMIMAIARIQQLSSKCPCCYRMQTIN